jgi:TPR repeat protein
MGSSAAQYRLGVQKDHKKAFEWFVKSAESKCTESLRYYIGIRMVYEIGNPQTLKPPTSQTSHNPQNSFEGSSHTMCEGSSQTSFEGSALGSSLNCIERFPQP